jgi:hypothetical protein
MYLLCTMRVVAWLGVVAALVWWAGLRPVARGKFAFEQPLWSLAGAWEQKEKSLLSGHWTHDDGFRVGEFGGKDWVKRLLHEATEGRHLEGCGNSHKDGSLTQITNQQPPDHSGMSIEQWWQEWWRDHQHQSQEEWVQEGFSKMGYPIKLPADRSDWKTLLRILGASAGPDQSGGVAPLHAQSFQYNAFRWLRDSGFEPVKYLLERPEISSDMEMQEGILAYQKLQSTFAQRWVPGRLPLSKFEDDEYAADRLRMLPPLAQPEFQVQVDAVSIATLGVSLLILLFSPRIPIKGLSWFAQRREESSS